MRRRFSAVLIVLLLVFSAPSVQATPIGPDGRVAAGSPNPRVVLILREGIPQSQYQCTGQLYGPDDVITAGHCVWSEANNSYYPETFRVYPGYNSTSNPAAPYGFCTSTVVRAHQNYRVNSDDNYDYGYLKLNCSIGNTTGTFTMSDADQLGVSRRNIGYPRVGGSAQPPPGATAGSAWRHNEVITHYSAAAGQWGYLIDTSVGHSGGPVFNTANNNTFAIHNYGTTNIWFSGVNAGKRFTTSVQNTYAQWSQL